MNLKEKASQILRGKSIMKSIEEWEKNIRKDTKNNLLKINQKIFGNIKTSSLYL